MFKGFYEGLIGFSQGSIVFSWGMIGFGFLMFFVVLFSFHLTYYVCLARL